VHSRAPRGQQDSGNRQQHRQNTILHLNSDLIVMRKTTKRTRLPAPAKNAATTAAIG
jgi:hypothetical protein